MCFQDCLVGLAVELRTQALQCIAYASVLPLVDALHQDFTSLVGVSPPPPPHPHLHPHPLTPTVTTALPHPPAAPPAPLRPSMTLLHACQQGSPPGRQ
jgi:hypothetical protein